MSGLGGVVSTILCDDSVTGTVAVFVILLCCVGFPVLFDCSCCLLVVEVLCCGALGVVARGVFDIFTIGT